MAPKDMVLTLPKSFDNLHMMNVLHCDKVLSTVRLAFEGATDWDSRFLHDNGRWTCQPVNLVQEIR
jgi:hypothetical protein